MGDMMIKVATVFSGIGSPEWALKRIGVDYKLIFACDNGERELKETKEEIEKELKNYLMMKKSIISIIYMIKLVKSIICNNLIWLIMKLIMKVFIKI